MKFSQLFSYTMRIKPQKVLLISAGFIFSTQSAYVSASENPKPGFYTIVDGQGRLIVIRNDNNAANSPSKTAQRRTVSASESYEEKKEHATQHVTKEKHQLNPLVEPLVKQSPLQNKPVGESNKKIHKGLGSNELTEAEPTNTAIHSQTNEGIKGIETTNVITEVKKTNNNPQLINNESSKVSESTKTKKTELVKFQETKYVDSQVLIDKSFNMNDEKRFYALPNGSGGVDFIERKSGINLKNIMPNTVSALFSMSSNYQRIPKQSLNSLLPSSCVNASALKKLDVLKSTKPLDIWPREGKTDDFYANIISLNPESREISVMSYASRESSPAYYWPLAIFLDSKGCAIEAAGQFFQDYIPATWLQQSGLKGNLLAPENAAYLMLTPLAQSPDLAKTLLSKSGQVRLTVFGTQP